MGLYRIVARTLGLQMMFIKQDGMHSNCFEYVGFEEFVVSGECVNGLGIGSMGKNYYFLKILQIE